MARPAPQSVSLDKMLDELEEAIEHLKVKYDRYFYGVDRVVPIRDRESVDRMVRNLMRQHFRTTGLRYRYAQLKQRYATYQHYWNRILTQIENGTYRRIVAESKRRRRVTPAVVEEPAALSATSESPTPPDPPAEEPESRARAARPPPIPARARLPDGLEATQARALFQQLVDAKRAAGENTRGITYGGLVQKLARELPKLQARHGPDVSFEVATVDGKVKLRARAR